MWIVHRKEIRKLTFRALALRRSESNEGLNARNASFRISLRWPIHIINPVDKAKVFCTPWDTPLQFFSLSEFLVQRNKSAA